VAELRREHALVAVRGIVKGVEDESDSWPRPVQEKPQIARSAPGATMVSWLPMVATGADIGDLQKRAQQGDPQAQYDLGDVFWAGFILVGEVN
jgi:hypothetical protein